MKLLLVEDEIDLSDAVKKLLQHSSYDVDVAYDGMEALYYIEQGKYDGIIMDIMMPKLDGVSVIKTMRANHNNTPVLILTAKSEIQDKVEGLDAGADDYLAKPFAIQELLARVRSLTRRVGSINEGNSIGNIKVDSKTYELTGEGSTRLTSKEYKLLVHFIRHSDKLLSTESLLNDVWDFDSEVEINVVWVYISSLRKKLKKVKSNYNIQAVRGIGYKLTKDD